MPSDFLMFMLRDMLWRVSFGYLHDYSLCIGVFFPYFVIFIPFSVGSNALVQVELLVITFDCLSAWLNVMEITVEMFTTPFLFWVWSFLGFVYSGLGERICFIVSYWNAIYESISVVEVGEWISCWGGWMVSVTKFEKELKVVCSKWF